MKHTTADQYDLQTLDKTPTEDKIELSTEEAVFILTEEEINFIVNAEMETLPVELLEEAGPEIHEIVSNGIKVALAFARRRFK